MDDALSYFADVARTRFDRAHWTGGFAEYLDRVQADPAKHTRTAFQLVHDMVEFYGSETFEDAGETLTRYTLFDDPFDHGLRRVFGLDRTIMRFLKYIRSAAREEGKERIFVFHGPVGTAKTTLVDLLAHGLEDYTTRPEGECYTFHWRFGKNLAHQSGQLGFGRPEESTLGAIIARVPCQLRDHPLMLVPKAARRKYLETRFAETYGDQQNWVIPHKILDGELCYNCRQIHDWLLEQYDGNWRAILEHVQVERFTMSGTAGRGIARVSPEGPLINRVAHLTIDEAYKFLANLISTINLVKFSGKYVQANRGIIHYSDLFKRGADALQHLLGVIEEHQAEFGDITGNVDVLVVGTTNLAEYDRLRRDPTSPALRSRMRKIDVPYLLRYSDEKRIYDTSLRQARKYRHITPHTTELAALFAVLTRLNKSYLTDVLPEAFFEKINTPLAKALLYNDEDPPDLSLHERELLTREVRRRLRNENPIPPELEELRGMLEGMRGIPTRILQNLFADLCEETDAPCIHPFQVIRLLERIIAQGPINYDFLNSRPDEGYHEHAAFVAQLRERYDALVTRELEIALIEVTPEEMDGRIRAYLTHVTAANNHETLKNEQTGADEPPDETLMRYLEDIIGVRDDDRDDWRFAVVQRASNAVKPGESLDLAQVYADLYQALYRARYLEKQGDIQWTALENALAKVRHEDDIAELDQASQRLIASLMRTLIERFGYCFACGREIALYVISRKRQHEHEHAKPDPD